MNEERLNNAIANAQLLMNDPKFINLNDTRSASNKKRKTKPLFESLRGASNESTTPNVNETYDVLNENSSDTLADQKFQNELLRKTQNMYGRIQEQVIQPQQQSVNYSIPQTNGIDYSIIKAIVNECLKEYSTQQLNEGVISGLRFAKGNKIQFLDSKGNLYEGVLTLKRKAQQK